MGQELSLLRRLFGHNPNTIPEEQWPGMAKAWEEVQAENPNAGQVNQIEQMGFLGKLFTPEGTTGFTGPFGGVHLDKEAIEASGANLGDVLTHETSHAGQGVLGWLKSKFGTDSMKNQLEHDPINMESARAIKRAELERARRNQLRSGGG